MRLRWTVQTRPTLLVPPLKPAPHFAGGLGVMAWAADALAVGEDVGAAFGDGGAVVGDDGWALAADAADWVAAQDRRPDSPWEVGASGPVSHRVAGVRR